MGPIDWMDYARQLAEQSVDPSTKVGAVIVVGGNLIISGGYLKLHGGTAVGAGWNHFPKGVPEDWWYNREKKYRAVVHAEVAALVRTGMLARGSTMITTHHPCPDCAKAIASAGISCVICPPGPWRDDPDVVKSVMQAGELLNMAGVEVIDALRVS